MTHEEIKTKVIEIVASKMGFLQSEISESTSFKADLGTDSLDEVELLMEFEYVFGIKIPDEEMTRVETVGDAINGIAEKLGVRVEGILLKSNSVDANGISYTPEALKKAVEDFRKECAFRGKQKEAQGAMIINHKTGDLEVMGNVVAASRFGRFIGLVDVGYGNDYSTVLRLAPRGSVGERTASGDIQSFTVESIDIIKHG